MSSETRENGYFEAFVNANAYRATPADRALMGLVQATAKEHLPPGNVCWAGSVYKGTAIRGSDLDALMTSPVPASVAQRAAFAKGLASKTRRQVRVLRHVVRIPPSIDVPRLDVAFENATFGVRVPPDDGPFRDRRARGFTVRALKLWTRRAPGLPRVPGWALEALVVGLDRQDQADLPLPTFLRVANWLATKATPENVLSIIKPCASPEWRPEWTGRLDGQVEALRNAGRSLLRRKGALASAEDVDTWIIGGQ